MELSATLFTLIPTHKFGISRETRSEYTTILFRLDHDGITGYGEAFPSMRYENPAEDNLRLLTSTEFSPLANYLFTFQPDPIQGWCQEAFEGVDSLAYGLTSAYYDYFGQRWGVSVRDLIGAGGRDLPVSSFTIGIDEMDVIRQKINEAEEYPILKVKLGTDRDDQIMAAVRDTTDKPVRVDANEGWTKEEAVEKINWLAGLGVEFIEQPIPAGRYDDVAWIREQAVLPVIADEDCRHVDDLPNLISCYDGINIKLVKCGGITPALRMIHTARTFGMSVMLGCMVESAAGIAPAAMLGGFADYLDLDGNVLLSNDPFDGPRALGGAFNEFVHPGLGVHPTNSFDWQLLFST